MTPDRAIHADADPDDDDLDSVELPQAEPALPPAPDELVPETSPPVNPSPVPPDAVATEIPEPEVLTPANHEVAETEEPRAAAAAPSDPVASPNAWYLRRQGQLAVLGLLLLLGVAVTDAILRQRADTARELNNARAAAVSSAKQSVPAVLSYDYHDLAGYPERAQSKTTGDFKQALTTLISSAVVPAAAQKQIVTSTKVVAASVVQARAGSVVLLLFIDQRTTSTAHKAEQIEGSRVRVTMKKVGHPWLISQFQPV
jgi:Mce-associated membrane protein